MLIVLSGPPGAGKTTVARAIARTCNAVHIRVDTIEQALRNSGHAVTAAGYAIACVQAEEKPHLGPLVIADCVNPWPLTCVESRQSDIPGHRLPTWQEVLERDHQPWTGDRLILDTARASVNECARVVVSRA